MWTKRTMAKSKAIHKNQNKMNGKITLTFVTVAVLGTGWFTVPTGNRINFV